MNQPAPPKQSYMTFNMRWQPTLDNFIVGPNDVLLRVIQEQLQSDKTRGLLLWGDAGVGKTHLLLAIGHALRMQNMQALYLDLGQLEAQEAEALAALAATDWVLLDNVEKIAGQEALEHALMFCFNECQMQGRRLMCAGNRPSAGMDFNLVDLQSRLRLLHAYRISGLDDESLLAVLHKRASAVGLVLPNELGRWLLTHLPADSGSLIAAYDNLERTALEQGRRLTVRFASEQLKL